MSKVTLVPAGYETKLSLLQTERAIKTVKDYFEGQLAKALHLTRVSAPLMVQAGNGVNDNLNGAVSLTAPVFLCK